MPEPEIDIDHLRQWIGRAQEATDILADRLVTGLTATLDQEAHFPARCGHVPVLAHFCLMPPSAPLSRIDVDGHPVRGDFLPPVPLPRRMWAASVVRFHQPLRTDERVSRTSRIADVNLKRGKSGTLVFVEVEHVLSGSAGGLIEERQSIVYRQAISKPTSAPAVEAPGLRHRRLHAGTVLLMRYSALTFNGHRIHYDLPYATKVEGYPGLVVHGPLQASLLAEFAAEIRGEAPRGFAFRGLTPLIAGQDFTLNAEEAAEGMRLWVLDQGGHRTMQAEATW